MKSLILAALAATALSPLAAAAGETTVVHERHVESGQPATVTGITTATTTAQHQTVVRRHTVRRVHYVRHRVVHHAARHVASAATSATTYGHQTSDVVTSAVVTPPTGPTTVDRRTVIHRSDDGTVRRHTTVQRQNPDGTVSATERRSVDVAPAPPPPPAPEQSISDGPPT